jgi:hypothetical protein
LSVRKHIHAGVVRKIHVIHKHISIAIGRTTGNMRETRAVKIVTQLAWSIANAIISAGFIAP